MSQTLSENFTVAMESLVPPAAAPAARGALRVALVTDADVFAGTERHMLELACGLGDMGLSVCIVCPAPSPLAERAAARGIRVIAIRRRSFSNGAAAFTLRRMLRNREVDIVHAHNGRSLMAAALAVTFAARGRCVATQHFISPGHLRRRGVRAVLSRVVHHYMARKTAHVLAISNAVRDAMVGRGQMTAERVTVVPNGIAAPRSSPPSGNAIRAELGLAPDALLIVCAARLEPEKGLDTLIAATAIVRERNPRAVCAIAGDGSLHAELENQIASDGVGSAVRLLGFRKDAIAIIESADVFVLPSPAEPFGLVLLEAMALAKPVVAMNAGGPAEIILPDQTGLLVPANDPAGLAAALHRLLDNPALRSTLGNAGRERWLAAFTCERMAEATAAVYETASAGRPAPQTR